MYATVVWMGTASPLPVMLIILLMVFSHMIQMCIANYHMITRDPKFIHNDLYELLRILGI